MLDKTSMFKVESFKPDGTLRKHQVGQPDSSTSAYGQLASSGASMMVAKPLTRCMDEQVKPLQIIWSKFPHQWSAANTVRKSPPAMQKGRREASCVSAESRPETWWFVVLQVHIDDLSRNFALNQGNGIKVRAFYRWVVLPVTAVQCPM